MEYFTGKCPTTLSIEATGTNISYQWYSNTINSTINASLINSATSASYTPPAFKGILYFFVVLHGDCNIDLTSAVVAVEISAHYTWNGSVGTDWNTATNWTPAAVPIAIDHINSLFGNTASIFENDSNEDSNLFKPIIIQYGLSGELLIELKEPLPSACHIRIHDMNAKLVYFSALNEPKTLLQLNEGKGIYFIEIDNSQTVFRKKIALL
jgi:hypothetical protein